MFWSYLLKNSFMQKIITVVILVGLSIKSFAQSPQKTFEVSITEQDLKKHLSIIAADSMQGRDTGSEGQKKAAKYIISQISQLGLTPVADMENGQKSYLQNFKLYTAGIKDSYVKINNKKLLSFKDYYPTGMVNVPEERNLETVFVGYGIKSDTRNDYVNKDVKGKAVIYLEGYPNFEKASDWEGSAGSRKKSRLAAEMGASFTFEVSAADAEKFKTLNAERKAILSRFNRMAFEKIDSNKPSKDPNFVVSKDMAADLLGISKRKFGKILAGKIFKTKPSNISIKSEGNSNVVETANIAGFIEGTDRKDEIIVVSAHYDHIGITDKGEINNGADDDGSGTCAVLEIAEAMSQAQKAGNGPRRSILFLWVTGEEKGLLGSQYYTDLAPIFPLANTMVDLNIDMIGRIDEKHKKNENYVYIIGSDKLSSELHTISENANKSSVNFELDYEFNDPNDPNKFYYRSDHYNFAKNKIPVAFYFTGVHEDYHKPGDDVEKIMFPKYTKIVKLVYNTLWDLANRDSKIIVDSNKK